MPNPVELDLTSPHFKADPFAQLARLRSERPVCPIRVPGGRTAWLITRHADALAVLNDPRFAKDPLRAQDKRTAQWLPGPLRALSRNMLDVDEPDHRRLRSLVQKAFTPRVVQDLRPQISTIAQDLLNAIAARADGADLIRDYASPLPVAVIAELLGVAREHRTSFSNWSRHIVAADTSVLHRLRAMPPMLAFLLFLRKLIRLRRTALKDDLLSRLIEAHEEDDRLSADELLAMSFLLLVAGHETTVNLIGNGMLALLQHPAELARLRSDPALIEPAVEEMLRFSSPLQTATERYATEDIAIAGVTIPRGALVYVSLLSANHDDRAFANPDRFDISREPNRHLAFGHGIHFCLGAPLARLEAQIAIGRLLERFPRIELATSPAKLQWRRGVVLRGVESLPVRLHGSHS